MDLAVFIVCNVSRTAALTPALKYGIHNEAAAVGSLVSFIFAHNQIQDHHTTAELFGKQYLLILILMYHTLLQSVGATEAVYC